LLCCTQQQPRCDPVCNKICHACPQLPLSQQLTPLLTESLSAQLLPSGGHLHVTLVL
jgi:hypothetical protein